MENICENDVMSFIQIREQLIERTRELVNISKSAHKSALGVIARELVNIRKDLRQYGIVCVEKIVAWTLSNTPPESSHPLPFMYQNEEYLCKMLTDLDFVVEELKDNAKFHHKISFEIG